MGAFPPSVLATGSNAKHRCTESNNICTLRDIRPNYFVKQMLSDAVCLTELSHTYSTALLLGDPFAPLIFVGGRFLLDGRFRHVPIFDPCRSIGKRSSSDAYAQYLAPEAGC
jgi:hypothetical protein